MTASATRVGSSISQADFLAPDFARLDDGILKRCSRVDGHRLYLSGATGFFGKSILALLAELGRHGATFEVTALSRSPEKFLAAHPWCAELKWLRWETGDAGRPWPGHGEFDLMLHAATDTIASANYDKAAVFDGILGATRQALAFAQARGVRRILLAGSGAQYGSLSAPFDEGVPENSALACDSTKSGSAYGEAKRASELLMAVHAERHGYAVINTRCFAFVGPGLSLDGHFAIGNFLRDALLDRPIKLASSGSSIRSYLYGADLAVWLLLLLLESEGGTTVNVGSDDPVSIVDLAHRVRDLVNPRQVVVVGAPQPGDQRQYYVPAIHSARNRGLDVWTSLDLAIVRTAMWHRAVQAES